MTRQLILAASLLWVALIVGLTVADTVRHGVTVRTVVGLPIAALLAIGVIGAIWGRPPEE